MRLLLKNMLDLNRCSFYDWVYIHKTRGNGPGQLRALVDIRISRRHSQELQIPLISGCFDLPLREFVSR